jgi:hypothetical protein
MWDGGTISGNRNITILGSTNGQWLVIDVVDAKEDPRVGGGFTAAAVANIINGISCTSTAVASSAASLTTRRRTRRCRNNFAHRTVIRFFCRSGQHPDSIWQIAGNVARTVIIAAVEKVRAIVVDVRDFSALRSMHFFTFHVFRGFSF